MSALAVLDRFGTWALVKFTAAILVFVLLHLVRLPVALLVAVLSAAMARVDRAVTCTVSRPAGPAGGYAGQGSTA